MAITLVTGTPGSGKTLYAVWTLDKLAKSGRRIVANGIRNLAIDHELWDDDMVREWYKHCQPNDVIVVDECQRIWPMVSASVVPSEDIKMLHTHRHFGVDVMVITQHPNVMNKVIRNLVGEHIHVRRLFGGRRAMLYQWDHCHNPNSGFKDAVKTLWHYPKKVFDLYTSAELHTKPKRVIPKALFVLPVALVVAVVLAYKGISGLHSGFGFGGAKASAAEPVGGAGGGTGGGSAASSKRFSESWRVVGRYSIAGQDYVLVAGEGGRVRPVAVSGFIGLGEHLEGDVDGGRVSMWSGHLGAPSGGSSGIGGQK